MVDMTTASITQSGGSFLEDDCNNATIDFNYYGEEVLSLYIRFFDVFELVILPVIALVGILANACFLFVIWKIRAMRTNLNKYLSALAVVDIFVFVFGLSDRYLRRTSPLIFDVHSKIFGLAGCPLNLSVEVTYCSSLMMVTLISLERYYAVCKPLSHRTFVGGKRTRRQIITAFALASFFVLLLIPYRGISRWACVSYPQNGKYDHLPRKVILCITDNKYILSVSEVIQALPFYTTLIASSYFYIRITYVLIQWEKKHPTKVNDDVSYTNETFTSESSSTMTYCVSEETISSVPSISSLATAEDVGSMSDLYSKSSTRSATSITSQRLREKTRANQRAYTS